MKHCLFWLERMFCLILANATTLTNKRKIKESPIFDTSGNIKYTLARSLASRAKRSHTHEGLVMGELSLGVKIKKRENINALSDQGNQHGDFSKALKRISEPKERVISINPVEKTKPETISNKTSNYSKTLADNCSETALVHYASSLSGSDAEGWGQTCHISWNQDPSRHLPAQS